MKMKMAKVYADIRPQRSNTKSNAPINYEITLNIHICSTQNTVTLPARRLGAGLCDHATSGYNPSSLPLSDIHTKYCCPKSRQSISEMCKSKPFAEKKNSTS